MSEIHLKNGSEMPKRVDKELRLYSCKYCPYAQRVRLILLAKNVPHHIVNINLRKKPDWFLELNPLGKVPVLDTGDRIIPESIDICNYLNDTYPEPPLYIKNAGEREHDQQLIKKFDSLAAAFCTLIRTKNEPYEYHLKQLLPQVEKYEKELMKRGKVPVLDTGNQVIPESIDICNYLNDTYPEPPLYTEKQARDQELIKEFDDLITIFYDLVKTQNESYEYHLEQLLPYVENYEKELTKRDTQYFGGDVPSMLDYMIFPFAERASLCGKIYGEKIPNAKVFPCLYSWCAAMSTHDLVKNVKTDLQRQLDIYLQIRNKDYNIDFDQ